MIYSRDKTYQGARFGRLVVAGLPEKIDGRDRVECQCDCGNSVVVRCLSLANGNTTSCGCLHREMVGSRFRRHGLSHTPTYESYANMINRCTDPENKKFADYGGRGIAVCERWAHSFDAFVADMGVRPAGMTLERKDTSGNYEPGNCRWATWKEQQNNKRSNRFIEFDGERLTLQQWADRLQCSHALILYRIRAGWTLERALTEPPKVGRNQHTS